MVFPRETHSKTAQQRWFVHMKLQLNVMITHANNPKPNVFTLNVMTNKNVVQMDHVSKIAKDVVLQSLVLRKLHTNVMITHVEKIQRIAHKLKNAHQNLDSFVLMVLVLPTEYFVVHLKPVQMISQLDALTIYVTNQVKNVELLKDVQKVLLNVRMAHACSMLHTVQLDNAPSTFQLNVTMVCVLKQRIIVTQLLMDVHSTKKRNAKMELVLN